MKRALLLATLLALSSQTTAAEPLVLTSGLTNRRERRRSCRRKPIKRNPTIG